MNKLDATKSILGEMKQKNDNIKYIKGIDKMDKVIMAMLYNLSPVPKHYFYNILEVLGNVLTIRSRIDKLISLKFIKEQVVFKEAWLTTGTELMKELDPTIKSATNIVIGRTALDRYTMNAYIFKYNYYMFLRLNSREYWEALGEDTQNEWLINNYVENIVWKRFYADRAGRAEFLENLPVLTDEEKEQLENLKKYNSVNLRNRFIKAVKKSWCGILPEEFNQFKDNYFKVYRKDPISLMRMWSNSIVDRGLLIDWTVEALCKGAIPGLANAESYVYDAMKKKLDDKAGIIGEMQNYDEIIRASQSFNFVNRPAMCKATGDDLKHLIDHKDMLKSSIDKFKKTSHIAYSYKDTTQTCLTYQVFKMNDMIIRRVETSNKVNYLYVYIFDSGYNEIKVGTMLKKLDMVFSMANLLDIPACVEFVSMTEERSRFVEKKLDLVLKKMQMGGYDIDSKTAYTPTGHRFLFNTFKPVNSREDAFNELIEIY